MASTGVLTWQPADAAGPQVVFVHGVHNAMLRAIAEAVASGDDGLVLWLPAVSTVRDGRPLEGLFRASRVLGFEVAP